MAKPTDDADMRRVAEALGFEPDNHHNAAKCPYCNPDGLVFALPQAEARPSEGSLVPLSAQMARAQADLYADMKARAEAAESKLSVLVEEMAGVVEALTADDYEALDDLPKLQPVEFTGHITWRFTPAVRDLIVKLTTRALASLQSPQEPTP